MRHLAWIAFGICLLGLAGWPTRGCAASYTITVTNLNPDTINPRNNEVTQVTYLVPTLLRTLTLNITDAAGLPVIALGAYRNISNGTYTTRWNGRNRFGAIVNDGVYTLTITGTALRDTIQPGKASITVTSGPVTYLLRITDVTQTTFDPDNDEQAAVTCAIPIPLDTFTATILDAVGNTVRTPATLAHVPAGPQTISWDGRDNAGQTVTEGNYSLVFAGQTTGITVLPASQMLTILNGAPPPTTEGDKGQILEGLFAANYPNMRYPGIRFGVTFVAPRSGTLTQITMQWKSSRGYGGGTGGSYTFELHENNPATDYPSDTVIGVAARVTARDAMDRSTDGAFHFPITATLTKGALYHLVITNVDGNAAQNWESPNTMVTRVQPWNAAGIGGVGNGRAISYYYGRWTYWTAPENPWSGGNFMVNGCHVPLMLSWTDPPYNTGDPYYCALSSENFAARIYGARKFGEFIAWSDPTTPITRIGFPIYAVGKPTGNLLYHLEEVGGAGELAQGILATPDATRTLPSWHYVAVTATLEKGKTYRLWLEAPTGTDSNNYYIQRVPYGESRPAAWLECGWGGTASYYTYDIGNGWVGWKNADMSFSLR